METPSMDTVYQAIDALYDNPNTAEKEKASIWLGDVQSSIHAWKVADELLHQKKCQKSCYFAAQTMRSKVQHKLSELPAEAVVSLRDSLVSHLEGITPDMGNPILTQLSLALADLALQMQSWHNCVSDLIKLFSNKNSYALLEILTVLPQEIDSTSLKLGENRREGIKSELRANSQLVMMFLKESINNSQSTNITIKIVKCMTSWVQVGAINIQEVPQNAVIGFSLQVLRDCNSINMLHDVATDLVCVTLHCIEENNNNDDIERLLFDNVAALEECYHLAVAHEDEEKAANYARIFTELAESFLEKIVLSTANGSVHFAMRSLELALVCVGHHDYEVAEITFNLWYRLSEEVYQRDYMPLTEAFRPHIERLIEALARHCQCEPDFIGLPDEGLPFYDFRMKAMEVIKDVVFIIGSSSVFRQMFNALQADISWEQTEAALFVMQAVAKNILPEEYEYVPKVVEAILSMPESTHMPVRKTCIQLLGELCEWIEQHSECLEPCLQMLITALHEPDLAHVAATALQNICSVCRKQVSAHAGLLLRATRLPDDLGLPLPTAAALMRAIAAALSRLPPAQLATAMQEAVAWHASGLYALAQGAGGGGGGGAVKKGSREDPAMWLDRLAALFRDVDVPPVGPPAQHPCLPALTHVWPIVEQVMNKYKRDGRVMERACRCVRFGVRACGGGAAPLLPALARALPPLYASAGAAHSCLLYLAAVLADALAEAAGARPALQHLLHALLPPALALLSRPDGLRDNPDTVDDLYRLCIRYLQRIPLQFLTAGEGEAANAVLQCAAPAASLNHREANSSVMKFLFDFVKLANSSASSRPDGEQIKMLANEALVKHGEAITYALLEASVLHLHSYMLSEVAEVLVELMRWQRAGNVQWVGDALQRLPRAPPAPTPAQLLAFHQHALRTERCKDATRLLRDFAKLYR